MLKYMHSTDRALFMGIWLFTHGWQRNLEGVHMTYSIECVLGAFYPDDGSKMEWVARHVYLGHILANDTSGRLKLHPDLVIELDAAMMAAWNTANE